MKSIKMKLKLAAIFLVFIVSSNWAIAGSREGTIPSIDHDVKQALTESLAERGYCDFRSVYEDLALARGIKAYLWDNRHQLTTENIPEHREADVVICLLIREGDQRLLRFFSPDSCDRYLARYLKK